MFLNKPKLTAEGSKALDVLASPSFYTVPYGARQDALADRLGIDLSAVTFALEHVPLALNGEEHRKKRAAIGQTLRDGQANLFSDLPALATAHFSALSEPGQVDVLTDCIAPFITGALARLTGCDPASEMTMVSRIFSQSIGPSQRKRMAAQIATLRHELEARFPDEADAIGERIALLALGRDALFGTISLSLKAYFDTLDGRKLAECPMPAAPTRTGVPYIDRSARETTDFNGAAIEPGAQVRCQLSTLEDAPEIDANRFFGAGAHVCLGRAISLRLFAEIAKGLSGFDTTVRVTGFDLRKDDVFRIPDRFVVEVQHVRQD